MHPLPRPITSTATARMLLAIGTASRPDRNSTRQGSGSIPTPDRKVRPVSAAARPPEGRETSPSGQPSRGNRRVLQ